MQQATESENLIRQAGPLDRPPRTVTLRAAAIACALMPLLAMWVVQAELIWYTGHSTAISLFFHVTFTIFLIALVNLWIRKHWPGVALDGGEILTIYVMLSVAGTLCSHDMLQIMIPMLTYPSYAANPQNRWAELILQHLPEWAIVTDPEACKGLAVGNSTLYNWKIFLAWATPLAFWSVFLMALMLALLCLNMIFRQPWTEKERLSFPIIQIPMTIATRLSELLRSKLFWTGFGIVAAIDILNGFAFLYPSLPEIPIVKAFLFKDYFVERPWNAIASTELNLYPFVIGLAFFLPTDLAFSCWFFFLFYKMQLVLTSAIWAVWLARRHLVGVARTVLGRPGGLDESAEPVRYRTALIGLAVCCGVLFACSKALGGSPGVIIVFFGLFFLYSLAIARMRCELGPPAHDLHFMGPGMLINNAVGTRNVPVGDRGMFSLFFWFNRAYRAHFSAHSMEGMKIAQQSRLTARSMVVAMITALVVGMVSAYWALLHALYVHGYSGKPAGQAFAQQGWVRMEGWVAFPKGPQTAATVAAGVGFVFTLLLGVLRTRMTWWLWHPVGYATATSWSMGKLWACLFIAWLLKALITRYGGARAYRNAIPFFIGLTLGEFVVGSLWTIYGALANTEVYHWWG